MSTQPDYLAAFQGYLQGVSDVSSAVGTRVFVSEIPNSEEVNMPRACAVLAMGGGGLLLNAGSYLPVGDRRLDVRCYGRTPYEAWQVYAAVHNALKFMTRTTVGGATLFWATLDAAEQSLRDPDVHWPFIFSSWQVLVADLPTS